MNEDEVIEQDEEIVELERPEDSWSYNPPAVDPTDALRREISELKAMIEDKG